MLSLPEHARKPSPQGGLCTRRQSKRTSPVSTRSPQLAKIRRSPFNERRGNCQEFIVAIGLMGWGRFADPKTQLRRITVPAPPTRSRQATQLAAVFHPPNTPPSSPRRSTSLQWPPSSMAQGSAGAELRWLRRGPSAGGSGRHASYPLRHPGELPDGCNRRAQRAWHTKLWRSGAASRILGPENGGPGISTYARRRWKDHERPRRDATRLVPRRT